MEHPQIKPPLPAEYYRRHAARVRQLASEATTSAVKEHLQDVAGQYERLAERVDVSARPVDDQPVAKNGQQQ
jgi:GH35 family endo-1,4-beta-xylanase